MTSNKCCTGISATFAFFAAFALQGGRLYTPSGSSSPKSVPSFTVRESATPGTLVERFDIEPYSDFSAKWANFTGLVLCCIDAKFCKKIFVGKLLTRSTRFTCFCTAQTSMFQKIFVKLFRIFRKILQNLPIEIFRKHLIEFCSEFDEMSEFRKYWYFRKCLKNDYLEFLKFLAK